MAQWQPLNWSGGQLENRRSEPVLVPNWQGLTLIWDGLVEDLVQDWAGVGWDGKALAMDWRLSQLAVE